MILRQTMQIQTTSDGSHTLFCSETGETYHSSGGAIAEALHVYLMPVFDTFSDKKDFNILEIGFGAGLNALITLLESQKREISVYYETVEPYPVTEAVFNSLNYCEILNCDRQVFLSLHNAAFDKLHEYPSFTFVKRCRTIEEFSTEKRFDAVFFDAFSPAVQPEVWTENIFCKLYNILSDEGIILTYSSKGSVKKALRNSGFQVFRLPGAGNKHHMLKAVKHSFKDID